MSRSGAPSARWRAGDCDMTEITWYIASTKGYLQQCDSLPHDTPQQKGQP